MNPLRGTLLLLLVFGGLQNVLCAPPQIPLSPAPAAEGACAVTRPRRPAHASCAAAKPRKLHGRFLHLTDVHPDPHYRDGMSEKSACHRKKPKKKPRSGAFGYMYGCVCP